MIVVYSHISSARLQYCCSFIFKELLGLDYMITIDSEAFSNHSGIKINYSNQEFDPAVFTIQPCSLLFETGIKKQCIDCFETNGYKAFYKTVGSDLAFDIFAASFFLLSRYEEYLPHAKDMYGRYAHENAVAFKEDFLQLPLINIWVSAFASELKKKYSTLTVQYPAFGFLPTYDIDIAYSYRHKGFLRNIAGFLKSPSAKRITVLLGLQKDPFDAYQWMNELHKQYALQPIYFFLVAEKNGQYDKNVLPGTAAMWRLVKQHAKKYAIGIHPSWQSGDHDALLKKEKQVLTEISEKEIIVSRQHYIRFTLPQGYQRLINSGIIDEHSMGYGSINGFRASVASSFYWYDLQNEKQTALRIHPFCFMDANSFYEQQFSAEKAYEEMLHYYRQCKAVNGTLITLWHNNFLGTDPAFKGWKEIYEKFIEVVRREW